METFSRVPSSRIVTVSGVESTTVNGPTVLNLNLDWAISSSFSFWVFASVGGRSIKTESPLLNTGVCRIVLLAYFLYNSRAFLERLSVLSNIFVNFSRIRAHMVRELGVEFKSAGAAVEISSTIGQGGGRVIVRLNGVVPVDRWTWALYAYVRGWTNWSQSF